MRRSDPAVFFITGLGHAGDHWLAKALNAHPEMFVVNAYEGVRLKYYPEGLNRGQRPDPVTYADFIEDAGAEYQAVGDIHTYRSCHMVPVIKKYGDKIRFLNLVRHPCVWLDFFTAHRANNCRMPAGSTAAMDHEWKYAKHELFARLKLKPYTREEVSVWAFYKGCTVLNALSENAPSIENIRIESLLSSKERFSRMVEYVTRGRCVFSEELLRLIYRWSDDIIRDEPVRADAGEGCSPWPAWKYEAFNKLVRDDVISLFRKLGYEVPG